MKILFWNTQDKNVEKYVDSLIEDNDIDIVVLVEVNKYESLINDTIKELNKDFSKCLTLGCKGISVWSAHHYLSPGMQDPRYSIQIIDDSYIMCCVHLQSDLHYSENERLDTIQQIMMDIKKCAKEKRIEKTIIIGDMNEMPYGIGCLSANGFHGLPSLSVKEQSHRTVARKKYRKFYNPMWNLFGDTTMPPGTYYNNKAVLYNPGWYMLDQVIISQEVLPFFRIEGLKILNNTSAGRLDNDLGRPCVSDHFPIICVLENVKEDKDEQI